VSYEQPGFKISLLASADLSTHQYKFVDVNSSGQLALASNGGRAIGVLQNKPTSGQVGELTHDGISKVVAGAAVTAGNEIMSDASGRAILGVSTNQGLGVALESAGGAGVLIAVLLDRRGTI
jgi:hypothetical protein